MSKNPGFDPQEIEKVKQQAATEGRNYILTPDEPQEAELAHIQFTGIWNGQETIFDAAVCTLSLAYDSKLYELAEIEARKEFPDYEGWDKDPEDLEDAKVGFDEMPEEIQEYLQDTMQFLETEGEVTVQEFVEVSEDFGYGIGLEVALHVEELSQEVLMEFVRQYTTGTFVPNPDVFSFPVE